MIQGRGQGRALTRRRLLGTAAVGVGAIAVRVPAAFAAGFYIIFVLLWVWRKDCTSRPFEMRNSHCRPIHLRDNHSPQPAGGGASVVGDRIWVNVRASAPARVKARLWPSASPAQVIDTPWYSTNRSDAARIPIPAASIVGTDWSWQGVVQDPLRLAPPTADNVRTLPRWPDRGTRSAFTFAFGSCITHLYSAPVLQHAAAADPKFFAIIGDMDYVDFGPVQDYALWSKWFRAWISNQYVSPLVHKTPIMGVQDDHDYGLDD